MVTYPPEKINGFIITWGLTPIGKHFTYPFELEEEIRKETGYEPIPPGGFEIKDEPSSYIEKMYENEERRIKTVLYLMKKYEWDFFMALFGGCDRFQHALWKYFDRTHPAHDIEKAKIYGGEILKLYQKYDGLLKDILDYIDDNTIVILMSDHGHGPLHKTFYVNSYLVKEGYIKF